MTRLQKLQLRQSELRTEMGAILDKEDRTDEDRSKLAELTREMRSVEVDLQAALLIEEEPETQTRSTGAGEDAEAKELDGLLQRASILPFMSEAVSGREVDGVEHELRTGLLGDDARGGLVPFEMLLPPDREERADTATTVAAAARTPGSQASVLQRVFTKTIAATLGVSMPMVPVGQANFPVITSGASASNVNAGTAKDAEAATFTGESLDPVRLSARYVFRYEDIAKLRSYESVLRRDLTATMADAMDNEIINGDGSAPNVSGFLAELTDPTDPAAASSWNDYLGAFTGQVDGINAYTLTDLRSVIGKATFGYAETLFRTGATDNGPRASACEYVKSRTGGQMVSSRIPAPASNIQLGIIAKTSYPGRNAVAPIWRALELIRDPYSRASQGEVALTAIVLWSFKIIRETGWALFKTRTA
ncbi:MAG: phage major capsid protein [Rhodospirillales bacterium]|nr:phage major capsid protein [Rhodospirillales bacterium]